VILSKDWVCPKCGYEQHEPIRVSAVSHPCHVNDKGERRTIPKDRALRPLVSVFNAVIVVDAPPVQLTLEGAA
jgi:hypothetical protein